MGILLTIVGFYLLFQPVIQVLNWIPFVGWLLGGVVAFAAIIFSLIVGTVISCLVIALAWVFYRPLIGVLLLVLMGIGIYFIFFFGPDSDDVVPAEGLEAEGETTPGLVPDSGNGSNPSISPVSNASAQTFM